MKKVKSLVITAMFLVSLLTMNSVISNGAPLIVWVDDNGPDNSYDHFDTIQEGINAVAVGGTVYVAAGTYSPSTNGESFPIVIGKNLTLIGDGEATTIINAEDTHRVITVNAMISVSITKVTITGGNIDGGGGGLYNRGTLTMKNCTVSDNEAELGGGIYNRYNSTLTMTNCTVSGNTVNPYGGGIYNDGTLTMTGCIVNGNYAEYYGGGIYNDDAPITMMNCTVSYNEAGTSGGSGGGIYNYEGIITMTNCTVKDNIAREYGGGILNDEDVAILTIKNSTISGNTADEDGGGIENYGTLTIVNCTVSGNTAFNDSEYGGGGIDNYDSYGSGAPLVIVNSTVTGNISHYDGGGILNDGGAMITIENCTISDNYAYHDGGGFYNDDSESSTNKIKNTIIANNNCVGNGPDVGGTVTSYGYNLIEDTSDCVITEVANPSTNITGVDPILGPLAYNSGPTQTRALLSGSPAIDAGSCTDTDNNPVLTDQRGVSRPQGSRCDIGAYEYVHVLINPIAAFWPVAHYHLTQVNTLLGDIQDKLPDPVPDDIQNLLDEAQTHIDNANRTGNSIYANNELLKALKILNEVLSKL